MILFFKSVVHVAGHHRGGAWVAPYVRKADAFADRAHAGQYRKGKPGAPKIPYIEHPRAVVAILHDEAGITDSAMLQAALLHDTMEDCGVTHANSVAEFGHDVADLVAELTNDPSVPREGKTGAQVAKAKKMSSRAAAVKTADKTANLRDLVTNPPNWDAGRRRRYFYDAREVVQAMGHKHPVLSNLFESAFSSGVSKI